MLFIGTLKKPWVAMGSYGWVFPGTIETGQTRLDVLDLLLDFLDLCLDVLDLHLHGASELGRLLHELAINKQAAEHGNEKISMMIKRW